MGKMPSHSEKEHVKSLHHFYGRNQPKFNPLWMSLLTLIIFALLLIATFRYERDEPFVEHDPHILLSPAVFSRYDHLKQAKSIRKYAEVIVEKETVILTYASYGYRANLVNWLVSLARLHITNYLIVCLDKDLDEFLTSRNIPCFSFWKFVNSKASYEPKKEKGQEDKLSLETVKKLWTIRLSHLLELLEARINVIFSDTDAIWVKNPLHTGLLSPSMGDIVASRGKFPWQVADSWGTTICMGLIYFHSTNSVIRIVKKAEASVKTTKDDQVSLNMALYETLTNNKNNPFRQYHAGGMGFSKPGKLNFLKDRTMAVGSFNKARVVLIPHNVIPRICNAIEDSEWRNTVQVAHCHPNDGKIAKTHKNWGNFEIKANIQEKYGLWCLANNAWESLKGRKFAEWLQVTSHSCDLPLV